MPGNWVYILTCYNSASTPNVSTFPSTPSGTLYGGFNVSSELHSGEEECGRVCHLGVDIPPPQSIDLFKICMGLVQFYTQISSGPPKHWENSEHSAFCTNNAFQSSAPMALIPYPTLPFWRLFQVHAPHTRKQFSINGEKIPLSKREQAR